MKKIGLFLAEFLTVALFYGCGDEVTKTVAGESRALELEAFAETDSLPACKAENLGKMALVNSRNAVYVCADSGWMPLTPSAAKEHSCELVPLSDGSGNKIVCDGDSLGVVYNGKDGRDGEAGATGEAGRNGRDCRTADNGDGSYWRICGEDSVMLYKAFCNDVPYDPDSAMCDTRDMRLYRTVKIGSQVWMAENLNFVQYIDTVARAYPEKEYNFKMGRCYEEEEENCRLFGRLYRRSWPERCPIEDENCKQFGNLYQETIEYCPKGWHVPDSTEWNVLFDFARENSEGNSVYALFAKEAWNGAPPTLFILQITDEFGFGILPAGQMNGDDFESLHFMACFHSMESLIYAGLDAVDYEPPVHYAGCSIRCVMDE